jgi:hypothetical protein
MVEGNIALQWSFVLIATRKDISMSNSEASNISLKFHLEIEDGWPPVAVESLPFQVSAEGYKCLVAPLFVKDLSVGDVVAARLDDDNAVEDWSHVTRSLHTTIWLLRIKQPNGIAEALAALRDLGCNTVGLDAAGCYAIDVPEAIPIERVDSILAALDSSAVAVAFPSMRHSE